MSYVHWVAFFYSRTHKFGLDFDPKSAHLYPKNQGTVVNPAKQIHMYTVSNGLTGYNILTEWYGIWGKLIS